jgi:hypothetical protein
MGDIDRLREEAKRESEIRRFAPMRQPRGNGLSDEKELRTRERKLREEYRRLLKEARAASREKLRGIVL